MLYNEFLENVKCRDNEHNYQLYKNLEIMYMNSDISKSTIYEYGRKLADNSLSEETKIQIKYLEDEISVLKSYIKDSEEYINMYNNMLKTESKGSESYKYFKSLLKGHKNDIANYKFQIKFAKDSIKHLTEI